MKTHSGRTKWKWLYQLVALGVGFALSLPVSGAESPEPASQGRIAEHQSFRSGYDFLSGDPGHIMRLIESGDANPEAFAALGLELSNKEWSEFERRQRLLDQLVPIQRIVTGLALDEDSESSLGSTLVESGERTHFGDVFSGIWLDQLDGGRLKLAVTDATKVDLGPMTPLAEIPQSCSSKFPTLGCAGGR